MRTLYLLIAFILFASPVWCDNTVGGGDMPWDGEEETVSYDFNGDKKVDIIDLVILIGKLTDNLTDKEKQTFDVNNDKAVDTKDIIALRKIILGIKE